MDNKQVEEYITYKLGIISYKGCLRDCIKDGASRDPGETESNCFTNCLERENKLKHLLISTMSNFKWLSLIHFSRFFLTNFKCFPSKSSVASPRALGGSFLCALSLCCSSFAEASSLVSLSSPPLSRLPHSSSGLKVPFDLFSFSFVSSDRSWRSSCKAAKLVFTQFEQFG